MTTLQNYNSVYNGHTWQFIKFGNYNTVELWFNHKRETRH